MVNDRNRESKVGGMTTKQKATIGVLVVIVLIIIWQVMGLFGGDSSPPPAPTAPETASTTPMNATAPVGAAAPAPTTAPGQSPAPRPVPQEGALTPQVDLGTGLRQASIVLENKMLEAQKNSEEKYIDQLNQLQLLKVQREIAEMNQAIATARLATVAAEKNVSELLTKPTTPPPAPPMPAGTYSNVLVAEGASGEMPAQQPPPPPVPIETPYVVISVSMQMGRWNAVMGYQGRLYNVSIGDVLPEDNSIVANINKNGVTLLSKQGKRRKVSILTSI